MQPDLRAISLCLVFAFGTACGDGGEPEAAEEAASDVAEPVTDLEPSTEGVIVSGFSGPESVVHDTRADVYLVSNVNGDVFAEDGNGFISRVEPDGTVSDLKWIDGAADGVILNGPKGLALSGDTLFVADLDVVRLFDRETGAPLGGWGLENASMLNDIAVAPDGTVYVSDSGVRVGASGIEDTGRAAIHQFGPERSHRILDAGDVSRINGIAERSGTLFGVASFGSGAIFSVLGGVRTELPQLPGVNLDGIIVTDDGGLLISDWSTQAVYLLRPNGSASAVVKNVESPADIGLDRRRHRLLIPGLMTDQVLLAPLPG
ncbi:MAG: SMP-30/gluconolactonase/LRE family protein [Gemmatimonadota bacterium]